MVVLASDFDAQARLLESHSTALDDYEREANDAYNKLRADFEAMQSELEARIVCRDDRALEQIEKLAAMQSRAEAGEALADQHSESFGRERIAFMDMQRQRDGLQSQLAAVNETLAWAQEKRIAIKPAVYMDGTEVWLAEHSVTDFITAPTILAAINALKTKTEGK